MFITKGAVLRAPGQPWEITDIEFDDPRQNELKVQLVASGLCHSDDHIRIGDIPSATYPMIGGHEGAGVVVEVGPDTPNWEIGDHLVLSFLPTCGKCRWCGSGHQNLCDGGALTMAGCRLDGSFRARVDGDPAGQVAGISTFCETTVISVDSAVKIAKDIPLDKAALVGCGVCTGWGSAVNSAAVQPGDTTIVMGIGGIGANALQGAKSAGATHIIAVDPVITKHELAQKFGATHTFDSMVEATAFAQTVTNGQGADSAIVTVGVLEKHHVAEAFGSIRKAGTVVVTGLGNVENSTVEVPAFELAMFQKRIQGSIFGESNPTVDIPRMLALYQNGQLDLDSLITSTYELGQINDGYADMHAGKNIRGVIVY